MKDPVKIKRTLDISCALAGLVLAAPLLLAISVLILASMGPPVLFIQKRPGKFGLPFKIYKFRTMNDERGHKNEILADHHRLTTLGGLLRSSSLDELPELINVLKGDMSLVGPRPLLMQYLPRYTDEQMRRHDVKPGLTGWAQVNGRNALDWKEKFKLDIWYVDNWSVDLDLKIIAKTFYMVFCRKGISHAGEATMPEFMRQSV